jgi:hypothetical protein
LNDCLVITPYKKITPRNNHILARARVGLTTLPPSSADCLEILEPQPLGTTRAPPGLYREKFTLPRARNIYYFLIQHCFSLSPNASYALPFIPMAISTYTRTCGTPLHPFPLHDIQLNPSHSMDSLSDSVRCSRLDQ